MSDAPLVNKVAQKKNLTNFNIADLLPSTDEIREFDISQFLFHGLLLKEKDFRASVKSFDWSDFTDKNVAVFCSTDAILAPWAFMIVQCELQKVNAQAYFGDADHIKKEILFKRLAEYDWATFDQKIVLLKGCGDSSIDHEAYMKVTSYLLPFAERISYGEACSFVPVYKKSKKAKPTE